MANTSLHAKSAPQAGALVPVKLPDCGLPQQYHGSDKVDAPYVNWAYHTSASYPRMLAAIPDLREGDQVLIVDDTAPPLKITPMKFQLFASYHYWAECDPKGTIVRSRLDKPDDARGEKLSEYAEAVILVYLPDRIQCCTTRFGTTKMQAYHIAVAALAQATDPVVWAKQSKDHELTLAFPAQEPWVRFVATVQLGNKRTSKYGNAYVPASSTIRPTSAAEYNLLVDHLTGDKAEANLKLAEAVQESYKTRVAEVMAKVEKRR